MSKNKKNLLNIGHLGHLGHVAFIGHLETAKELAIFNHVFGDVKLKGCDIVIKNRIRKLFK